MSVLEKVKKILATQLNISEDEITEDKDLKVDLGADSLDAMEIILAIEEEFNVSIDEDKVTTVATVGDLVKLLG